MEKKALLKGLENNYFSSFFLLQDLLEENNRFLKFIVQYKLTQCCMTPAGKKFERFFSAKAHFWAFSHADFDEEKDSYCF